MTEDQVAHLRRLEQRRPPETINRLVVDFKFVAAFCDKQPRAVQCYSRAGHGMRPDHLWSVPELPLVRDMYPADVIWMAAEIGLNVERVRA